MAKKRKTHYRAAENTKTDGKVKSVNNIEKANDNLILDDEITTQVIQKDEKTELEVGVADRIKKAAINYEKKFKSFNIDTAKIKSGLKNAREKVSEFKSHIQITGYKPKFSEYKNIVFKKPGEFYSSLTKMLKELKTVCSDNKKCALSTAMAGLCLVLGVVALVGLDRVGMDNKIAQKSHTFEVVNISDPMFQTKEIEIPLSTRIAVAELTVTGVPVSVGLPPSKLGVLALEDDKGHEYKIGDSCAVNYVSAMPKLNAALSVGSPFNILNTVYNLRVDGDIVASFKTPGDAKAVMDKITAMSTNAKSELIKLEYKETVEITKDEANFMDVGSYSGVDAAVSFLMTGTKEMKKYSIVAGDIPETIAEAHGMTIDELEAANPSIVGRGHLLQIGEELNLVIPKPLVTVLATERQRYVKDVEYAVVENANSEMYEGETVVQQEGEYGRSEVVAEIVKENGREISRTILSEKVLKEPKKEVVMVGSKPAPPKSGSGYLDYPLQRGFMVTSPFGMRWGFLHTGIDLACPQGTPIVAADGGQVVFAGWDSLGGLMIKIDHGGGIETGYAHCDFIAVSEGEMVFKGQYIGDVGMTGYTSGPHLHFEVVQNGVHTDPSEYLAFY